MKKQTPRLLKALPLLLTFNISLLTCFAAFSQSGAAINTTGAAADPSAAFEVSSTTGGALIPRMTTIERNAIQNPATGLQIFNTTTMCFEYFAYGIWQQLHCAVCPMPDVAGAITGSSSVCQGINNVNYSVPAINNANSYIWSYSGTGATINGNSESITIDFSSSATSGNLTVKGTNQCGDGVVSSNFSITVNSVPSAPTASTHTPSQTEIVWNWNSVQGATGYKYNTTNNFANATDNGTSTSLTQNGLTCNTSYTLYVWAYNDCGASNSIELNANTSTCWSCNIGDSKEGGIVFYNDVANNKCYVSATSDQSTGAQWGCSGNNMGTGTSIGIGSTNTTAIVLGCSTSGIAARICDNLILNGYSDWFLPSKDELNQMYIQKNTIGGISSSWYWSSSEYSLGGAWGQNFANGTNSYGDDNKTHADWVRCIRRY